MFKLILHTKVWRKWVFAKKLDDVMRNGFIMCGTGKVQPKWRWVRSLRRWLVRVLQGCLEGLGEIRLETDGGHTFGFALLACLIHKYFPEHLSRETWILVNEAGIFHEVGEIVYGDRIDDGSHDRKAKSASEAEVLAEYFRDMPDTEYLVRIIERAEYMKDVPVPYAEVDLSNEIDVAAWWLGALDKTEALLQNGRYKTMDAVGRIGQKDVPPPSARDAGNVKQVGTDDIVFVWSWQYRNLLYGSVLWDLVLAMMMDIYDWKEIPVQFFTHGA